MINGFADQKSVSTIYKICFQHGDGRTRRARVWWLPVEESEDAETVLGISYKHMYYLRSRFAENSFLPLSVASGMAGVHGITFPFGHFQREEFIIIRDKDLKQVFHLDSDGVSVCGPSDIKDLGHR